MRLWLIAPGATAGTRNAVFGDQGSLVEPPEPLPVRDRIPVFTAPEPGCLEAASVVAEAVVLDALRGPDFGAWTGLALEQVLAADPAGVQQWLADPDSRPHQGESLRAHLGRIAELLDGYDWPASGAALIASAFSVRAGCLYALGAGPGSLRHLDIAPGTMATISRHAGWWRLESVIPPRRG